MSEKQLPEEISPICSNCKSKLIENGVWCSPDCEQEYLRKKISRLEAEKKAMIEKIEDFEKKVREITHSTHPLKDKFDNISTIKMAVPDGGWVNGIELARLIEELKKEAGD